MKNIKYLLLFAIIICLTGCFNSKEALEFKKEYESLNGKTNSSGKKHRTISIDKNNPYIKITQKDIVKKIENKETFYLYIGDPKCPWCRSVIEQSIKSAKEYNIDEIYYINIWDKNGNEIFRDKYELKDGELTKTVDGTEEYYKLLKYFDSVLEEYTLTNDNNEKIDVKEKRIFAPNYFYIEKGKVKIMIDGISSKQEDSRETLTKELIEDEEKEFKKLFNR